MTDDEFKKKLSPEAYAVLREGNTEAPFTGKLLHNSEAGTYRCAACGNSLFSSETKFDSGPSDPNSGWPHFWKPISNDSINLVDDNSYGMQRTEVTCAICGSYLGHVFPDPKPPSGKQYCINSVALDFKKDS